MDFKVIMSNSAAFYFDMTDDKDPENFGLKLVRSMLAIKTAWLD